MAAIILGAGVLAYDQVKKSKEKRAAKRAHNEARFAALERETSARLSSPPPLRSCTSPTSPPDGEYFTHDYEPGRSNASAYPRFSPSSSMSYNEPVSPTGPPRPGRPAAGNGATHKPQMALPSPAGVEEGAGREGQRKNGGGMKGSFEELPSLPAAALAGEKETVNDEGRRRGRRQGGKGSWWSRRRKGGKEKEGGWDI